jgi:dihydroxynaphthoic acid synthetase
MTDKVLYERDGHVATITYNRPEAMNALSQELRDDLDASWVRFRSDDEAWVAIVTGAGRAFCAGHDLKGGAVPRGTSHWETPSFTSLENGLEVWKPVIAAVNGYAIGGGQVLHVLCDLTIAADTARFGQTGPRVGSFDAGFGTAYLARVIGEKRAREVWMLCRQYDADTAERWGLVNKVVPAASLHAEVRRWADEILALSPTALRFVKQSFNVDTEHLAGVGQLAFSGLELFVDSDEAREGVTAFGEKRRPDYARFRSTAA